MAASQAWTQAREREARVFFAALSRMARIVRSRRARAAATPLERLDPVLALVLTAAGVTRALGPITPAEQPPKGAKAWASIARNAAGATVRLGTRGSEDDLRAATEAAVAGLRANGHRVALTDLVRAPDQNGYVALIRIAAPRAQAASLAQGAKR